MNNTVVRTFSGIGFVAILVASLMNMYLFAALFIFVDICLMAEFYKITMGDRYKFSRLLAILTGVVLFCLIFAASAFGMPVKYVAFSLVPLIIVMINSLYVKDKAEYWKFSFLYTGLLYISTPMSLSNLIAFNYGDFDGSILLCFFIIIWASDVGAFVFGCSLGKHFSKKLFPAISPKKTWIGVFGGTFCAVLSAIVLSVTGMLDIPLVACIVLAVVMDIAGVYGDLFESQWKRFYEVKDSGTIIPGHGGMLDRFDSSMFAIPAGAIVMILFDLM